MPKLRPPLSSENSELSKGFLFLCMFHPLLGIANFCLPDSFIFVFPNPLPGVVLVCVCVCVCVLVVVVVVVGFVLFCFALIRGMNVTNSESDLCF